jgi:DNA-binding transcriptional regulator YiaG
MKPLPMHGNELREALDKFGMTQMAFARLLDADGSTVRRWLSGALKVPTPIALLVRVLVRYRISPETLR